KVINSLSAKRTHSLPVTPVGTSDKASSPGNQTDNLPITFVSIFCKDFKFQ
ncbi:hypothetical protein ABZP36_012555, partial [Zizania latifolia]